MCSSDLADHAGASLASSTLAAPAPVPAQAQSPTAIVFVDSSVKDYQQFLTQSPPGALVVTLDSGEDGVAQIAATLGKYSDVQSVHIVSHGSAGELHLGSTVLDAGSLGQHAADLAVWNDALAPGADILVYGCDVGAGASGQALVSGLAALTGADVAASTDATGSAALGGDWVLERSSGSIETAALAPTEYAGLLAAPTFDVLHAGNGLIQDDVSGLVGSSSGEFVLEQADGKVLVGGVDGAGVLIRHNADEIGRAHV